MTAWTQIQRCMMAKLILAQLVAQTKASHLWSLGCVGMAAAGSPDSLSAAAEALLL